MPETNRGKEYADEQPRHGETVLHCGHIDGPRNHFWKVPGGTFDFRRPDGTEGSATWLVACHACFQLAKGDASLVQIRGDGTWKGDAPIISKREEV